MISYYNKLKWLLNFQNLMKSDIEGYLRKYEVFPWYYSILYVIF